MQKVFLSIGGNIGDKANNLKFTRLSVENEIGKVASFSSVYETPAWGFESGDLFWNQVLEVETLLAPMEILGKIKIIEDQSGRVRSHSGYSSRAIDIDILYYGELILATEELAIPHPRLAERKFVLVPLAEIAPHFIHPQLRLPNSELLVNCSDNSIIRKLDLNPAGSF